MERQCVTNPVDRVAHRNFQDFQIGYQGGAAFASGGAFYLLVSCLASTAKYTRRDGQDSIYSYVRRRCQERTDYIFSDCFIWQGRHCNYNSIQNFSVQRSMPISCTSHKLMLRMALLNFLWPVADQQAIHGISSPPIQVKRPAPHAVAMCSACSRLLILAGSVVPSGY